MKIVMSWEVILLFHLQVFWISGIQTNKKTCCCTHPCSWAPCRSTLAGRRWGRWAAAPPAGGNPCGSESGRFPRGAGPARTLPQSEVSSAVNSSAWRLYTRRNQGSAVCILGLDVHITAVITVSNVFIATRLLLLLCYCCCYNNNHR